MSTQKDKREITFDDLWALLSPDERLEAVREFWLGDSPLQRIRATQVISVLAQLRNFREKFVRERPLEWKILELNQKLSGPLNIFIDDVLREFLFTKRKEMICALLDAEGTAHENGWVSSDAAPPTSEAFVRGLKTVRSNFKARDLILYYYVFQENSNDGHWHAFSEAADDPSFHSLFDEVFPTVEGHDPTTNAGPTVVGGAEQTESNDEFTTLDNLLIKTVVATATEADGALKSDAAEDLVQEVVALGAERHRSYFHIGFLDAILGRDLRAEFTGANVSRRGWCLTGYLMGRLRSATSLEVIQLVKNQTKLWEELLNAGPMSARVMLLPHFVSRFADACEWRLLRTLLERARLPTKNQQAVQLCEAIYNIAATLIRQGSSEEAVPLLEILHNHLRNTDNLPNDFQIQTASAVHRKIAQAHLRAGRFEEAKKLLTEVLSDTTFSETASAHTDMGLANARFRSLDFLLPKEDIAATETIVRALEKQVSMFEEALKAEGRPTNAQFVLGLIAFHRGDSAQAEYLFSNTLSGMLEKEEAYQTGRLVDWTRFLLSILIVEECEPARLNEVKTHVECSIASPAVFPLRLWERLCRNLSLYDDLSLAESIIYHLLKNRGDLGYRLMKESGLLTRNSALRGQYQQWLQTQPYAPSRKAAELEFLLDLAFKDSALDEAVELLDSLEGVAKRDADSITKFLALLKSRRSDILTVWDEVDVDNTEAALLERIGQLSECEVVLKRIFFRNRAEGDWSGVVSILNQIENLELPECDLARLRAQAEHLRPVLPCEPVEEITLDGVAVLYVGGDETQIRYEESLRSELQRKHPGLKVSFYYPGWDTNWTVHLEKLLRMMPKHNVIVINNFVRTQFGRKLRAVCGRETPWRACTGHGRKSLLTAIEVAARWVASNSQCRAN